MTAAEHDWETLVADLRWLKAHDPEGFKELRTMLIEAVERARRDRS